MRSLLILAACIAATAHAQTVIDGREVAQELYPSNPLDYGDWGVKKVCANGSFVEAIEIKYAPPGHVDETAINGIVLYCRDDATGIDTGHIQSAVGPDGDLKGMQVCPSDYITGFRAKVLKYQGKSTDDVAVQDLEVQCEDGNYTVDALPGDVPKFKDFNEGDWGTWSTCVRGLAVCGLWTKLEDDNLGDDVAISNFVFYCCYRDELARARRRKTMQNKLKNEPVLRV